ncbi:hypothetical protein [Frankia sp. CiP3]|uniref:hypothetical protein n=1 Tax=Frankia sp. CiP3 TaxID=2880971 RepID=UPI001EF465AB|nr:hypothetical protein [Frankia sp. CiP3]
MARVLTITAAYTTPDTSPVGGGAGDAAPSPAALVAVDYAAAQLGLPYQWGADGPAHAEGFDRSRLTKAAHREIGWEGNLNGVDGGDGKPCGWNGRRAIMPPSATEPAGNRGNGKSTGERRAVDAENRSNPPGLVAGMGRR